MSYRVMLFTLYDNGMAVMYDSKDRWSTPASLFDDRRCGGLFERDATDDLPVDSNR